MAHAGIVKSPIQKGLISRLWWSGALCFFITIFVGTVVSAAMAKVDSDIVWLSDFYVVWIAVDTVDRKAKLGFVTFAENIIVSDPSPNKQSNLTELDGSQNIRADANVAIKDVRFWRHKRRNRSFSFPHIQERKILGQIAVEVQPGIVRYVVKAVSGLSRASVVPFDAEFPAPIISFARIFFLRIALCGLNNEPCVGDELIIDERPFQLDQGIAGGIGRFSGGPSQTDRKESEHGGKQRDYHGESSGYNIVLVSDVISNTVAVSRDQLDDDGDTFFKISGISILLFVTVNAILKIK